MMCFYRDQNNVPITMYCVDCRIEGKELEDCLAVFMADNTTRCIEHFDKFIIRNKL